MYIRLYMLYVSSLFYNTYVEKSQTLYLTRASYVSFTCVISQKYIPYILPFIHLFCFLFNSNIYIYNYTYIYFYSYLCIQIYIFIYIYMYVCILKWLLNLKWRTSMLTYLKIYPYVPVQFSYRTLRCIHRTIVVIIIIIIVVVITIWYFLFIIYIFRYNVSFPNFWSSVSFQTRLVRELYSHAQDSSRYEPDKLFSYDQLLLSSFVTRTRSKREKHIRAVFMKIIRQAN